MMQPEPSQSQHNLHYSDMLDMPPAEVRSCIAQGRYNGQTAGLCPGYVQANLVIVAQPDALDFFRFCQRNAQSCPLVAVSDTGRSDVFAGWGAFGVDLRHDLPGYYQYQNGVLVDTPTDIDHLWTEDMVAFLLGCSFTFESALVDAGIELRHLQENKNVAMYRTALPTVDSGAFSGPLVVSMRPIRHGDVARACSITARFPHAHGAPVHIGDPSAIGIDDLSVPDWGDSVHIADDEVPVFWACGVTPQAAIRNAKPALCITHAPGHMLITNIPDWQQSVG